MNLEVFLYWLHNQPHDRDFREPCAHRNAIAVYMRELGRDYHCLVGLTTYYYLGQTYPLPGWAIAIGSHFGHDGHARSVYAPEYIRVATALLPAQSAARRSVVVPRFTYDPEGIRRYFEHHEQTKTEAATS